MAKITLTPEQKKLKELKKRIDSYKDEIAAGKTLTPAQLADMDEFYGPIARLISSNDDLLAIFQTALHDKQALSSMGQKSFMNEVRKTKWYAQTTENQRLYATFASNPQNAAELQVKREEIRNAVQTSVVQELGLNPDDPNISSKMDSVVDNLLRNNFQNWEANLSRVTSAAFSSLKATEFGAKIGQTEQEIRSYYKSMGMSVDPKTMGNYTRDILNNKTNLATIQQNVQKNAAQMWGQFGDRINAGETIDNILYPYKQLVSSILEIDPEQLDLTWDDPSKPAMGQIDPLLQKALFSGADSKSVMSLTDLRKAAKQDKRWQYTRNAKDEYASLTKEIMGMFGAGV